MSTANEYMLGDDVQVSAAFETPAGVLQDPTTVKCTVRDPEGTETTYVYGTNVELVKDSTGNYHILIDANKSGTWYYRFFSLGTGKAADEGSFEIGESVFS